jgi:hypothetical protein
MADVRIHEVNTEIVITEPIGPLSAEDVKRVVNQVLQILKDERERSAERRRDTQVHGNSADAYKD